MIKEDSICDHHPPDHLLRMVSQGLGDASSRLMVETHLLYCPSCRKRFDFWRAELATEWQDLADPNYSQKDADLLALLKGRLVQAPSHSDPLLTALPTAVREVLQTEKPLQWRSLWPARGQTALVLRDEAAAEVHLGSITAACSMPSHRHSAPEQTLVLQGEYQTQGQRYQPGDWVEAAAGAEHAPSAGPEGCLCLTRVAHDGFVFTGYAAWRNAFM